MSVAQTMRDKLEAAFAPQSLEIVNQSAAHAGHSGDDGSGETHFFIRITSDRFRGLSRIQSQRLVHGALADELAGPVHALALRISAPDV